MIEISRQRRWQLKKRKQGCCIICGLVRSNVNANRCDSCARKFALYQREKRARDAACGQ